MEGLSFKKIWTDLVRSIIVMLYLLDNDTSKMILFSSGLGLVIESWKLKKASNVSWDRNHKYQVCGWKIW